MMRKMRICQCLLLRGISLHMKKNHLRLMGTNRLFKTKIIPREICKEEEDLPDVIRIVQDRNIIYSSFMSKRRIRLDGFSRRKLEREFLEKRLEKRKKEAVPLIVEKLLLSGENILNNEEEEEKIFTCEKKSGTMLPYSAVEDIDVDELDRSEENVDWNDSKSSLKDDISRRLEAYEQQCITSKKIENRELSEDQAEMLKSIGALVQELRRLEEETPSLGTCNPKIPVSDVPCGGCGAMLHCQDFALPGFLPVEMFEGRQKEDLKSTTCQRCYFLKHYDMALNVRVSPSVYEKLLQPIKDKKALVIVVVDLLDIPCSIWPNVIDIVGTRRPVVIVGNKVDLLPADGRDHLKVVKKSLMAAVDKTSLGRANIKHTVLVSAYTGFGIEDLITKLQNLWGTKGDIYILGCTNSGKSSLFNALLGSDMCKATATDLIQRATTSLWPGTTLNMLKFPMLRPSGYRLYQRTMRLKELQKKKKSLDKGDEYTTDVSIATLSGHIGRTFVNKEVTESMDPFSVKASQIPKNTENFIGIKDTNPKYVEGKWCYDTPGTIQPDQMINLLTHEELMMILPRKLIKPQTFQLSSGKSLFIGGLARFDLLYCPVNVIVTVFASGGIPITIVKTVYASAFYRKYLGTRLLGVPTGNIERLQLWPHLAWCDLRMTTHSSKESSGDVVLSSAGWITVTAASDKIIEMRGWTPGGRGIYLRTPSMLPRIASMRGPRIPKTPAYMPHKILVPRVNTGDEMV